MKRTVEINDTLDERVDSAKDDLRNEFAEFRKENPDMDPADWEPHDRIHEIADGSTPIYTKEIDDLWWLYAHDLDSAYDDAGIGNRSEDNYRQVAIYCYIEQKLWNEARSLMDDAHDEWLDAQDVESA